MRGFLEKLLGGRRAASLRAGQSSFKGIDGETVANIDRSHLISILTNSSEHAGKLYDYLRQEYLAEPQQGRNQRKRVLTGMLRKAATLRDSLDQVAKLVAGEDLGEPAPRDFPLLTPSAGAPLEVLDSVVEGAGVHSDKPIEPEGDVTTHVAPLRDAESVYEPEIEPLEPISMRQVREAQIYQLVKDVQDEIKQDELSGEGLSFKLQHVLDYIKEGQHG